MRLIGMFKDTHVSSGALSQTFAVDVVGVIWSNPNAGREDERSRFLCFLDRLDHYVHRSNHKSGRKEMTKQEAEESGIHLHQWDNRIHLRDRFAGMAMQGLLGHCSQLDWQPEPGMERSKSIEDEIAELSFKLADAMIKERSRK